MAGLDHRGSEQRHNLSDRYADSTIRIRPCQPILHGTLREQLVGLAKQETIRVAMDNLDYSWQRAYMAAVREAYGSLMRILIHEALAAIELRRLNLIEIDGEEDRALRDAERALETLKAELSDGEA